MKPIIQNLREFRYRRSPKYLNGFIEFLLEDGEAMMYEIGTLRANVEYYEEIINRLNTTIQHQEEQLNILAYFNNMGIEEQIP